MPAPTTTPVRTPVEPKPEERPWQEQFTDPWEICPQQVREVGSPDIAP